MTLGHVKNFRSLLELQALFRKPRNLDTLGAIENFIGLLVCKSFISFETLMLQALLLDLCDFKTSNMFKLPVILQDLMALVHTNKLQKHLKTTPGVHTETANS